MGMTVQGNQAPLGGEPDASTGQLVKQLSEEISQLVRDEVRLASLEMTGKAKTAARGAGLFGGSGIMALYGTGCLLAAAIIALARGDEPVAGRADRGRGAVRRRGHRRADRKGPAQEGNATDTKPGRRKRQG
jgi:hypothetical protein